MQNTPSKFSPEKWCILIPARLGSTRLPNKPILDYKGKPLVIQTANVGMRIKKDHSEIEVAVVTDSKEIVEVCSKFDIKCIETTGNFPSGSDRVFSAAKMLKRPFIINLQCDEPDLDSIELIKLMNRLEFEERLDICTLSLIHI